MSDISKLGNGIGWIFATGDAGTTATIQHNIPNDKEGAQQAKELGIQSAPLAQGIGAVGTITITAVTVTGSVSAVSMNGVDSINGAVTPVVYVVPGATVSDVASDIADAINDFDPGSGPNYSATSIAGVVYIIAPASAGSTPNGTTISVSDSGGLTFTTADIEGGSDSATSNYDVTSGYRFYLDATAGAVEGTLSGDEITAGIVPKYMNGSIPEISATIASAAITYTRQSAESYLIVDTEGATGTDTLSSIVPTGTADGDEIIIRGAAAARVTTIDTTGNITLTAGVSFSTGDGANSITLRYKDGTFFEIGRSTQQVGAAAAYRTATFPFLTAAARGNTALTATDNTTVTLTVNSSTLYQTVTGTATLAAGNYVIAFSTTGAVAGDRIIVEYNALVTEGANTVIIGGKSLRTGEALIGGLVIVGYYDGSAWQTTISGDFNGSYKLDASDFGTGSVGVTALTSELKVECIVVPVSFETGELCNNRIKFDFAGTVTEIYAVVTKAIAATDNATITPKNDAGTTMTSGVVTFTASDALETANTTTPSGNNTFVAGDILYLTTAKTTAGGKALVSIYVTRS